jgi:uncharacterized protein with HEPN domain
VRTWIVHHLQVIGKAVRPFARDLRALRPQVPWAQIVGIRHTLVHQHYGVDPAAVWAVVETDLPALKSTVTGLLDEMADDQPEDE